MNEEKVTALETELSRQHQIVSVLLKHNAQLELEKEALLFFIEQTHITLPYRHIREALPELISSYAKTRMGKNELLDSLPKNRIGKNEPFDSHPEKGIGIDEQLDSNPKIGIGIKESIDSHPTIGTGKKELSDAYPKTGIGKNEPLPPLPATIQPTPHNTAHIADKLQQAGWRYVQWSTLLNVAKLFIHIYNKNNSASTQLCKLTGLSAGGLAKLMMAIRKRGYLQRTGKQSYVLTLQALNLLQQAGVH